jgi:hypothetical protein
MSPISKRHLHFSAWPADDRALWAAAFEGGDHFDEECRAAHMATATKIGLRSAYARYLGYLTLEDPERLCLLVQSRPDRDCIRAYVKHLRQSCRDTSVASTLHKLRFALGLMCPEREWSWLKIIAKRINAQATPRPDHSQGATSAVLFVLGLQLMAQAENSARVAGWITKEGRTHLSRWVNRCAVGGGAAAPTNVDGTHDQSALGENRRPVAARHSGGRH